MSREDDGHSRPRPRPQWSKSSLTTARRKSTRRWLAAAGKFARHNGSIRVYLRAKAILALTKNRDEDLAKCISPLSYSFLTFVKNHELALRIAAGVLIGSVLQPCLKSLDLIGCVQLKVLEGFPLHRFDLSDSEKKLDIALVIVRRDLAWRWRRVRRRLCSEVKHADASSVNEPTAPIPFDGQLARIQQTLDPTDRKLVEMRLFCQSDAEIARALKLDAGVFLVRLHRLHSRFKINSAFNCWI